MATKKKKKSNQKTKKQKVDFDKDLLKIIGCPVALQMDSKKKDPGALRLYKDNWLISDVSKYKYPIVDGIPILLKEVGEQWVKTKDKDLPIPAPSDY